MLHQKVLTSSRIAELEEQLAKMTKRRGCERKRVQTGGMIEYGTGVLLLAKNYVYSSNGVEGAHNCSEKGLHQHNGAVKAIESLVITPTRASKVKKKSLNLKQVNRT